MFRCVLWAMDIPENECISNSINKSLIFGLLQAKPFGSFWKAPLWPNMEDRLGEMLRNHCVYHLVGRYESDSKPCLENKACLFSERISQELSFFKSGIQMDTSPWQTISLKTCLKPISKKSPVIHILQGKLFFIDHDIHFHTSFGVILYTWRNSRWLSIYHRHSATRQHLPNFKGQWLDSKWCTIYKSVAKVFSILNCNVPILWFVISPFAETAVLHSLSHELLFSVQVPEKQFLYFIFESLRNKWQDRFDAFHVYWMNPMHSEYSSVWM